MEVWLWEGLLIETLPYWENGCGSIHLFGLLLFGASSGIILTVETRAISLLPHSIAFGKAYTNLYPSSVLTLGSL